MWLSCRVSQQYIRIFFWPCGSSTWDAEMNTLQKQNCSQIFHCHLQRWISYLRQQEGFSWAEVLSKASCDVLNHLIYHTTKWKRNGEARQQWLNDGAWLIAQASHSDHQSSEHDTHVASCMLLLNKGWFTVIFWGPLFPVNWCLLDCIALLLSNKLIKNRYHPNENSSFRHWNLGCFCWYHQEGFSVSQGKPIMIINVHDFRLIGKHYGNLCFLQAPFHC